MDFVFEISRLLVVGSGFVQQNLEPILKLAVVLVASIAIWGLIRRLENQKFNR